MLVQNIVVFIISLLKQLVHEILLTQIHTIYKFSESEKLKDIDAWDWTETDK